MSQLVALIVSPVITRIYSPEEMGLYTLYISFIALFTPILNGRIELTIVSASSEDEIIDNFILSIVVGSLISIVCTIVIFLVASFNIFNSSSILKYFLFFPVILFFNSLINSLSSLNNKYKEYNLLGVISLKRSFYQYGLQILLGVLSFSILGLLFSNLASLVIGVRKQSATILKKLRYLKSRFSLILFIRSTKRNFDQIVYSTPAVLLNTASFSFVYFILNSLYSEEILGNYSISYRVLGLPLIVISSSVSRVLFEGCSDERNRTGNYSGVLKKSLIGLCIFSIPSFGVLMAIAPDLFRIAFGEMWIDGGIFVSILCPMYAIRFIVSPLSLVLTLEGKQKIELLLQMLMFVFTLVCYFLALHYKLDSFGFMKVYSGLMSLGYLLWLFIILRISKLRKEANYG